ncbi:MAG: hypothetical protein FJZ01_14550 [Candidatus Sericytochromatia bacterium]|nr:hypothetical protein [Candidatus Tanganyikabacteria bacterium]
MSRLADATAADPLLLLPADCRRAAVIGNADATPCIPGLEWVPLDAAPDAIVALYPAPGDLAALAQRAWHLLAPGGTLVAHVPNPLPGRPLRPRRLRRLLAAAGFPDVRLFAWLSTTIFRQVLFALGDRRMAGLLAGLTLPGERRRVRLARSLGAFLPASWLVPRLLVVARKEP